MSGYCQTCGWTACGCPPVRDESRQQRHDWRFPVGDKTITITIDGTSELTVADVDDLIRTCAIFRRVVKRMNLTKSVLRPLEEEP